MPPRESKVTIHMVASLDGYIAKRDGSVEWMNTKDHFEKGQTLTEQKISEFLSSIECYVMGSKTYELALELGWPYGDHPVFVFSSRRLNTERESVHFMSGDHKKLIDNLRSQYNSIWIVGGAQMIKKALQLNLADEIVLSTLPILIGNGLLFFDHIGIEAQLHLTDVTAYENGMVETSYSIIH